MENSSGSADTGSVRMSTKNGICTHYCARSMSCMIGFCKLRYRCSDRSCKKEGKIHDIYRERNVTNYEFMKSQYTS